MATYTADVSWTLKSGEDFLKGRCPCGRLENAIALTTLDPKTALIVIDLQKGIVGMPTVNPSAEVVKHATALAGAHANSTARICTRLDEIATREEIIDLLNSRASQPTLPGHRT
jgi:hypothetical protein